MKFLYLSESWNDCFKWPTQNSKAKIILGVSPINIFFPVSRISISDVPNDWNSDIKNPDVEKLCKKMHINIIMKEKIHIKIIMKKKYI